MSGEVHVSKVGTYHPNPKCDVAWTINDVRGNMDPGPACEGNDCPQPCYCDPCEDHDSVHCEDCHLGGDCIGLSFTFICLDVEELFCAECAERQGITISPCDCEEAHT